MSLIFLVIVLIISLIVFCVCCIKVGIIAEYISGDISLSAKFARFSFRILPKSTEKQITQNRMDESRTPRKKKQKTKKKMERRIHLALGNDELIAALKKICIGIGKFNKGINVDRFFLHFVAGGYDPYDVTGIFALVNALICTLAPVFADRFHCRKLSVSTDIDYNREDMLCDVSIEMTVRIGRIFAMINTILFGLIVVLIKNRILWYRLKCSDPEEYEFERAHPSAATKLIMGLLNNKHQPVGENAGLK